VVALIVETIDDPNLIAAEWDVLADRTEAPPWLRPGWILPWSRWFSKGRLEVLCVRGPSGISGVLPMVRSGSTASSAANSETPFSGLLADDAATSAAVADSLFEHSFRRVTLWPLEAGSRSLEVCERAADSHGYRSVTRVTGRSPYVPLDEGWDTYRESVSSKVLSEVRRRRRKLEAEGHLSLDVEDGMGDIGALLAEGLQVEASGWKGAQGTAIATRPEALGFYKDVTDWASSRGSLLMAFLRLDGRPIAFDLCLEEGGVHFLLKTSFDPEFRAFGPGILIRHDMIERAFGEQLVRYEFLGHDEEWKHRWAKHFRDQILLKCYAPTVSGRVERALYEHGAPVARRIRGFLERGPR
jgi:CelD/BcsL family acetyltransferase involved in cellulose biosynthesis